MKESKKVIFVDIDETICFYENSYTLDAKKPYHEAVPNQKNIEKINNLYDAGNEIVYWTARGSRSGIDWSEFTREQLDSWGCRYHEVRCDKPYYDIFIEDRSVRIEELK
jgi:histidinol phosphatase-like enzyme